MISSIFELFLLIHKQLWAYNPRLLALNGR